MGKPDKNLFNLTSNESFSGRVVHGDGYSDAVKCSNLRMVRILNCLIFGGSEDCIDINRGGDILVEGCTFHAGGNFISTIKGGASNVRFINCIVSKRGKETDFDLGNWSDQSQETTRKIFFENCIASDGKPIRIRCLWADDPILINTKAIVTRVPAWQLFFFKLAKKLGWA